MSEMLVKGNGGEMERQRETERVMTIERHPYVVPVCPREHVMVMGEKRK